MTQRSADKPKRLFVACDLPGDVLDRVSAWQAAALAPQKDVRVVRSLHITLVFLGDVPQAAVPDVGTALQPVAFRPFDVGLEAPLFLPQRGAKHVVALHLADPSGALARLQADASQALQDAGLYTPSKRPWLGHVTVARFRRPGHPFPLQNVTIPQFGVDRMVLYSSLLEKASAVHTPVAEFPAS